MPLRARRTRVLPRVVLVVAMLALAVGREARPQEGVLGPPRSDTNVVAQAYPSPLPAYVQRGGAVEARYRAYRECL
jgi:hypothetical protein